MFPSGHSCLRPFSNLPSRNSKCSYLAFFLILCTLLPLRFSNWFVYLSTSNIPTDLTHCSIEGLKSENEECLLNLELLEPGVLVQDTVNTSILNDLEKILKPGGSWMPHSCKSPFRVALVIPYRDRPEQLKIFLQHIHPFMQRQNLDYQIFVSEQSEAHPFNRAKLFNIGFKEALKIRNFCCFIFHDVDLLPVNLQHIYSCSKIPRHMCSSIDVFRYVLPYSSLFGGVIAISRQQFESVNGFSNTFFGWGGEDDNFYLRLKNKNIDIIRWDPSISRYTMLSHKKAKGNPNRHHMKDIVNLEDGLNDIKYKVLDRELKPLYTWILSEVDPSEP